MKNVKRTQSIKSVQVGKISENSTVFVVQGGNFLQIIKHTQSIKSIQEGKKVKKVKHTCT